MKRIAYLLLVIPLLLCGCAQVTDEAEMLDVFDHNSLEDKELIIENEHLLLQFDCETTQISVTDKAQGTTWHSNPPDASNDSIAVSTIKERLQSQVVLTYGQMNGISTELNNYALSVLSGNYSWQATDNSIKVNYTIGKVEKVYVMPKGLPESEIMVYYDQMDTDGQKALDNYYRIIDINKLRATDDEAALREKYPAIDDERIFELREGLQAHIMERIELAFENIGYTMEDYLEDLADIGEAGIGDTPVFNISVIYALDGRDFTVTVPLDEIEHLYDYPILTLTLLPYFGAAGQEDEGFMFVPDASGAIIRNNNGKENQQSYSIDIYGFDSALKRPALVNENFSYMPVFGVSRENDAFVCVIEDGAANCSVEADVSGRMHTYNNVNSKFTVTNWDDVDISKANVQAKVFDRNELTGILQQRYIFIESSSYADMAVSYRDYLMERNPSLSRHNETDLPIVLGLVGAIDKRVNVMGVPVVLPYALTTYSEAADIINRFTDSGITGMRLNYIGWFNGGVQHDEPSSVSLVSKLGKKQDFANLLTVAEGSGTDLYFEADFTYINDLSVFNSFIINRDAAKRLSREEVRLFPYCKACFSEHTGTYGRRYSHYLANPQYTMDAIDSFHTQFHALGGEGITFSSIGRALNSDFNAKNTVSRSTAMEMQTEKLSKIMTDGTKIMIHGGNVYAVPYADAVINMMLEANNFNIIDGSVPFYQIALHGIVPYTGSAINLSLDYQRSILKAVETGAGLQFLLTNATGEDLKETNYSHYFAADIARWGDEPIELYHRLNNDLRHTAALFITGHRMLAPSVMLTEYEDGTQVVVNYSSEAFMFEDLLVGSMDYAVVR